MEKDLLFALYGGDAWVAAGGLVTLVGLSTIMGVLDSRPWAIRVARTLVLVALVVAAFTGTPLALWAFVPAAIVALAFAFYGIERSRTAVGRALAVAIALIAASLALREALHLYRRPPPMTRPLSVAVIGDSLTSGGFGERTRWPDIVARDCGIRISDLSSPSATTADAIERQLPRLGADARAVFLEIGGNDMLEGRDPADFEKDLDAILSRTSSRRTYLLEFPVLPGRWRFAAAERRVARARGAILVPKRVLAAVLTDPRNTFDGLHLDDRGHAELARRIEPWLGCR